MQVDLQLAATTARRAVRQRPPMCHVRCSRSAIPSLSLAISYQIMPRQRLSRSYYFPLPTAPAACLLRLRFRLWTKQLHAALGGLCCSECCQMSRLKPRSCFRQIPLLVLHQPTKKSTLSRRQEATQKSSTRWLKPQQGAPVASSLSTTSSKYTGQRLRAVSPGRVRLIVPLLQLNRMHGAIQQTRHCTIVKASTWGCALYSTLSSGSHPATSP